ncbi:hypothetical protein [Sphingomonas aerolata]|uniref:hypothetical protein n=1 Tax=Sphingomonas aerolata TaxID=185951 RepID=UPI002FE0C11A
MQNEEKRIIGRTVATELSESEITQVAGGGNWQDVRFTIYDTNGGSDDTQLQD